MEIVAALLQPGDRTLGWIVAPSRDLCDRILQRVVMTFNQYLAHRVVEWEPRQQRLIVRNLSGGTSEVRAKSAENAVSLLGECLDWIVVEEASKLDHSIWENHLAARLVDRRGWGLIISTPNGPNWFWRLFRRGQRGRDPTHESWQSPSWENPFIDAESVAEERRRLPHVAFAQEFAAEFIGADQEPCETCGGPSRETKGSHIIVTDAELPRCTECRHLVDLEGKTVVRLYDNGARVAKVVWLSATEEPELEPDPAPDFTPQEPPPQFMSVGLAPGLDDLE